ncbi:SDR family NAD(P)-dependent oxidoreductase [Dietzia sp. Marseille-Q0999]|nr:SDR family NAD(P)-dependent oxidoreductase [Dietzia massiliensis]
MVGDVRKSQDVDDAVAKTVEEFGGLDIVIANAGIFALAPASDMSDDVWSDVIDINLSGVFRTVRAAARQMQEAGTAGRIITISSMAGRMAFPNAVAYTSAKFGVIGMTKTFAEDLGTSGITVNAVCPTNVNTPMIRENPDAHALFTGKDDPSEEEIQEGAKQFTSEPVKIIV